MHNQAISSEKLQQTLFLIRRERKRVVEERNSSHFPLDLLILLILNQSTSDRSADLAFARFKQIFGSYNQLLVELSKEKTEKKTEKKETLKLQAKIEREIKICGLAKTKAFYILETLKALQAEHRLDLHLQFINTLSNQEALRELIKLRGVGIKSASCLLLFSFRREILPLDTHLLRIFKRLGIILQEKISSERAHRLIQPLVTRDNFLLHVSMIELGRQICFARKPRCEVCYLSEICQFNSTKIL